VTIAQLIAPLTPYVADEIYTNLTGPISAAPDSVHLADWPVTIVDRADPALRRRMALVRKLVTLGRSARTEAKVRVRQPLDRALVVIPASEQVDLVGLEGLVAEELNVKSVELVAGVDELVSYTVKPNFKALGPRFGARMRSLAQAIEASDPAEIVHALERDGAAHIDLDGEQVSVTYDDLDVRIEGKAGFSLVQDGPYGVALHLELTPELEAEGVAREVVRGVQELRKSSGLAVEDRVELWLNSESGDVLDALTVHSDSISSEVLATSTHLGEAPPPDASTTSIELDQGAVEVWLKKA
jgi:isoleucyl-tRNA synthetase